MKDDFTKLLISIWLCGTAYGIYEIWANVSYISDLMSAYMQMFVNQIRK
jgi:hypothetical protein|tara:strand:+ start:49 stop:195 length:147 start_codon:yes stop_codon:yes gene_type:complete